MIVFIFAVACFSVLVWCTAEVVGDIVVKVIKFAKS